MKHFVAIAAVALSVFAQNVTDAATSTAAASAAASAPAAPAATTQPAGPSAASGNSISIISPNGNIGYKSGDPITITWNNNGDTGGDWVKTAIQFELADASKGVNKVTPIGAYLNGSAVVGDLELKTTIPANVPAGSAYCVRADIRGTTGFQYFFSPNFPINQGAAPAGSAGSGSGGATTAASAPAAQTTTAAAAAPTSAAAITTGPAAVSKTGAGLKVVPAFILVAAFALF